MKLTEYAKSRDLPLNEVREAARENGFHSDHYNSAVNEEQESILDGWFAAAAGGPFDDLETPCTEALPEYFTVELPHCLLGKRLVRVTRGETFAARETAAFEQYKQSGGILGSRFVPIVTPIDDPSAIEHCELLEQETV